MIEKAYIELMHKEIDGVIDAEEKKELLTYLKTDEEAARYYHDLVQTANLLNEVPEVNPPKNLKTNILSSLDWRRYSPQRESFSLSLFLRTWFFKPKHKLAYSFALGVVAGILAFALVLPFMNSSGTLDTNDLYGTIGIEAQDTEVLQHIPVQLDELNGNIYLKRLNDFIIFEVQLNSEADSELRLEYESSDYQFRGIEQNANTRILFEEGNSFVEISNSKDANYQIYFLKNNAKSAAMNLKIKASDRILLHQAIFVNPIK